MQKTPTRKHAFSPLVVLAAAMTVFPLAWPQATAKAGELPPTATAPDVPSRDAADPFAEAIRNSPMQVTKTGPSCQIIKIPLPEGVEPEEIPGLETP